MRNHQYRKANTSFTCDILSSFYRAFGALRSETKNGIHYRKRFFQVCHRYNRAHGVTVEGV